MNDDRLPCSIESATDAYCQGFEDAAAHCVVKMASVRGKTDALIALAEVCQWCLDAADKARK